MSNGDEKQHMLLSDEPVRETERERKDLLAFEPGAGVLARAALYAKSPITIGVYGSWGSGKTSFMRLIHDIVAKEGQGENAAVPVWFNAWQYEREEHLIIPLIATIARDIKKREEEWEKEKQEQRKIATDERISKAERKNVEKALVAIENAINVMKGGGKKVHDVLRSVLFGLSMSGKFGIPKIADIEISASMKDMIERYEAVTQDTLMARSLYFNAFDKLRELAQDEKEKKPQIVVFIDDLDRCFPEQAVKLLESVKLVLHQPGFAFVLGIYPQIVEEFIRNKYAGQFALAATAAITKDNEDLCRRMNVYLKYFDHYLEKIVQVRHVVPEREAKGMLRYVHELLVSAGVLQEFMNGDIGEDDLCELIAEVGERNPREIVRKINGLVVKWRIAQAEGAPGKEYNLLAGLINLAMDERISRDKQTYEDQFLHRLELPIKEEKATAGKTLAKILKETKEQTRHTTRIDGLLAVWTSEKSATMNGLLTVLRKDPPLCNVLGTEPGQNWLSKESYRKESREAYKEEPVREEPREAAETKKKDRQDSAARKQRVPDVVIQEIVKNMVSISAGEFLMGSKNGDPDEKPVHKVKLKAFEIGATPVTQAQYEAIMGSNPSQFEGHNLPVECVSWNDALVFCEQLNNLVPGGGRFTLPTEAQWEYACRAGTTTEYCFGDDPRELGKYAWFEENSRDMTHPVSKKKPNEWGLYDMHGNVLEWCLDTWHEGYKGAPTDGKEWVNLPYEFRVLRGGCWNSEEYDCRSFYRCGYFPENRDDDVGFRIVRNP